MDIFLEKMNSGYSYLNSAERESLIAAHAAEVERVTAEYDGLVQQRDELCAEVDQLLARVEKLEEVLGDCIGILELSDGNGARARGIRAEEDSEIRALCERFGYGAVMDSAQRQWFLKDANGCHTTGACALSVRKILDKCRSVIEAAGEEGEKQ